MSGAPGSPLVVAEGVVKRFGSETVLDQVVAWSEALKSVRGKEMRDM